MDACDHQWHHRQNPHLQILITAHQDIFHDMWFFKFLIMADVKTLRYHLTLPHHLEGALQGWIVWLSKYCRVRRHVMAALSLVWVANIHHLSNYLSPIIIQSRDKWTLCHEVHSQPAPGLRGSSVTQLQQSSEGYYPSIALYQSTPQIPSSYQCGRCVDSPKIWSTSQGRRQCMLLFSWVKSSGKWDQLNGLFKSWSSAGLLHKYQAFSEFKCQ